MADITTIELKKTTHGKLKSLGEMGESFDDVVNRLIDFYNYFNKKGI